MTATQNRIFTDRYQQGDETIPDMWDRVASWVANNEKDRRTWYDRFRWLVDDFKFIPGGRINFAAGHNGKVTAHNCFVIPKPDDSIEGIYHSLMLWAKTMARGGGVGINMSSLRPRSTHVVGSDGTSSGPIPFMELFTTTSKDVIQQGGTRRGAAMIILEDWHPDIWDFIEAKTTFGKLEGANISVGISNAFMEAIKNDTPWNMKWKGKNIKTVSAKALWDKIAEAAWKSGEPGILFLDRCNDWSNLWYLPEQRIECVNPCSEIPLPANGCCLLGTFNLERFVKTSTTTVGELVGETYFDWYEFSQAIQVAVRFLDNVIDVSYYPLEEYRVHQEAVRQMGMGITGLADALIRLGLRYGSPQSIEFVQAIFEQISYVGYKTSTQLAKEKGSFPLYDNRFLESEYVKRLPSHIRKGIEKHGIRNSYLVGQQPSGTGSLLAGVNSGIEPVYAFDVERQDRTGTWSPETTASKLYNEQIGDVSSVFVSAHELTPFDHINIQAAAQRWCDQAISKTVNCPEDWKVEDVKKVYQYAWDKGLKSVAVYRDKSRPEQVLTAKKIVAPDGEVLKDNINCRSGACEV